MGVCASQPQQEASGPTTSTTSGMPVAFQEADKSWPRDVTVAYTEYARSCKFGLVFTDIERLKAARDFALTLLDAGRGEETKIVAGHTLSFFSKGSVRFMTEGQQTLVEQLRQLVRQQRPQVNRRLSILRKSDLEMLRQNMESDEDDSHVKTKSTEKKSKSRLRSQSTLTPIGEQKAQENEEIAGAYVLEDDDDLDSVSTTKRAKASKQKLSHDSESTAVAGVNDDKKRRRTLSDVKLRFSELDYAKEADLQKKDDQKNTSAKPEEPDSEDGEVSRSKSLGVRIMDGHSKAQMTRSQRKWSVLRSATKISGAFRNREISGTAAESNFQETASLQDAHPDRLHATRVLSIYWAEQGDVEKAKHIMQKGIKEGEEGLAHAEFFDQATNVLNAMKEDLEGF